MMGTLTEKQKEVLAKNIFHYRSKVFPGKGGSNRLAAEIDVSPQTISHWINGRRIPNNYQTYVMSRVFGISIQKLCGIRAKGKQGDDATPYGILINIMQKEDGHGDTVLTSKKRRQDLFVA